MGRAEVRGRVWVWDWFDLVGGGERAMCSWCFFLLVSWGSIQGGSKAEMLNRRSFDMLLDGYALGRDFYRKGRNKSRDFFFAPDLWGFKKHFVQRRLINKSTRMYLVHVLFLSII